MTSQIAAHWARLLTLVTWSGTAWLSTAGASEMPVIREPWIQITGNPDLGELGSPKQQPVDFAIWQAADGSWQVLQCIRNTKEPGHTRLLYQWEGAKLTDPKWKPMGVAMHAAPTLGEAPGGLQAPYVFRAGNVFNMYYGDWNHICRAASLDGKTFQRVLQPDGKSGIFDEGNDANTRDPMVLKVGDTYYCYDAAYPAGKCSVYGRTSTDLKTWSAPVQVAFGGTAGDGKFSAECPFVIEHAPGEFYLFRTQHYGKNAQTSVYYSSDPLNFGINHDEGHFLGALPLAAPEIVHFEGRDYIAALLPALNGVQIAPLDWPTVK